MARRVQANSKKRARFRLVAPEAEEVFLVGDFTRWQDSPMKMNKNAKGEWTKQVSLDPGEYQYQYIVDGSWWTDPATPERVRNEFGSENSVKRVS